MKNILSALFFSFMLLFFTACKKDTPADNSTLLVGTWNLASFDGAPMMGTFVFTANTSIFTSGANTESDTYVKNNNTLTFTKTGGDIVWISIGNNWTINTLTANSLKITSSFGLVITASR